MQRKDNMNPEMTSNSQLADPVLATVEVEGLTRSSFILKSALAAGSVYGASTVAPFVGQAFAKGQSDVDILNFALTLEYLEADFYAKALKKAGLGGELKKLAQQFGDAEQQHVDALTATVKDLGGTPATKPRFSFPISDRASFLKLATTLEDTGVSAYNGAGPSIKSAKVLAAAGSIVQVEARHAAAIRLQANKQPSPNAFDKTLSKQKVLAAVKPLIKA